MPSTRYLNIPPNIVSAHSWVHHTKCVSWVKMGDAKEEDLGFRVVVVWMLQALLVKRA